MDRAVVTILGVHEITQIVRILHPLSAWIGAVPNHSKPQCFGDSRDSKNDSIWGARREMQRRRRHAPSCMGATDGQRNWPEMRKTLGKPGFLSGEGGIRTPGTVSRTQHFQCCTIGHSATSPDSNATGKLQNKALQMATGNGYVRSISLRKSGRLLPVPPYAGRQQLRELPLPQQPADVASTAGNRHSNDATSRCAP